MKNENGWFNLNWPYDLREHPGWQVKFPLGPVHWDIRRHYKQTVLAEAVSAHDLRARIEALF